MSKKVKILALIALILVVFVIDAYLVHKKSLLENSGNEVIQNSNSKSDSLKNDDSKTKIAVNNKKLIPPSGGTGLWSPKMFQVQIVVNNTSSLVTECCGGDLQKGVSKYFIDNNLSGEDYIIVYFAKDPSGDYSNLQIDKNIIENTANVFNAEFFKTYKIKKGQHALLEDGVMSMDAIDFRFIKQDGIFECPPGAAC